MQVVASATNFSYAIVMCLQDEPYSCFASRKFDTLFIINAHNIYALLEIVFVLLSGQTFAIPNVKLCTYMYIITLIHFIVIVLSTRFLFYLLQYTYFVLQALCAVSLGSCCALALRAIC